MALSSSLLYISRRYFGIDWEATDDFHPDATDSVEDYEKNAFLDLSKPLLRQVWEANFRCVAQCQVINLSNLCLSSQQIVLSSAGAPASSLEGVGEALRSGCSRGRQLYFWNVPTLFLKKLCSIDVHANGVVCCASILGSGYCVFVPAVSLPIYWTPTQLYG